MAETPPSTNAARGLVAKLGSLSLDPDEAALLGELIDAGRGTLTGENPSEVEGFGVRTPSSSWILFFDEADALFGSRAGVGNRPLRPAPPRPGTSREH